MNIKTQLRRLSAALVVLSSVSAFAGAQVVPTHPSIKLKPNDPVPAETPANLLAARNEFASFQIVVKADANGASNVSASLAGLEGPSAIGPAQIQLYREEYLNLTQMSFQSAAPGRYPDALVPDVDETVGEKRNAFPFSIPANESRVIWVDVLVPQTAKPGIYTGTVEVRGDGVNASVPVSLSVIDAELPTTSSVATAFLFHRNNMCSAHTGNSECTATSTMHELAGKYQKLALEHRITLSNTVSYPSNGDWALFDERYTPWLEGKLSTRLPGAKMTTVQYPGRRDPTELKTFADHLAQKGWLSRAYDYTGDEPPFGISFAEAKSRVEQTKSAAPGLRTLLTTTIQASEEYGIAPTLDLVVPVINHLDGTEAPYIGEQRPAYDNFVEDPQNELWVYQSCMSHGCAYGSNAPENKPGSGWPSYMVDASAARNRAMQWVVFLQDATGELYYETALKLPSAWDSIYAFNGNGDGTLFYPGTPARIGGQTDVPVPSFRLKQIRQGMQDYEWLKKVADAGDPEFARQIAKTLIPSSHQVGDDGEAFELARRKLISRWLELQPKNPDNPPILLDPQDPASLVDPGEFDPNRSGITGAGCSAAGPGGMAIIGLVGLALALLRRR